MHLRKPDWESPKCLAWDMYDWYGERKRIFIPRRFVRIRGEAHYVSTNLWKEKLVEAGIVKDPDGDLCVIDDGDQF